MAHFAHKVKDLTFADAAQLHCRESQMRERLLRGKGRVGTGMAHGWYASQAQCGACRAGL